MLTKQISGYLRQETAKGQDESGKNGNVLYLSGSYTVMLLSKLTEVYT